MRYKFYFRKSSFKKDLKNANLLLELIKENKPSNFLEIGVLEGATSRNICELLNIINNGNFKFTGVDLFGAEVEKNNEEEFTPISNKISNPLKWINFNLNLKLNQNSEKAETIASEKVKKIKEINGF